MSPKAKKTPVKRTNWKQIATKLNEMCDEKDLELQACVSYNKEKKNQLSDRIQELSVTNETYLGEIRKLEETNESLALQLHEERVKRGKAVARITELKYFAADLLIQLEKWPVMSQVAEVGGAQWIKVPSLKILAVRAHKLKELINGKL